MTKPIRSIAVAIMAAALLAPVALAQTEGQQQGTEIPAAQSDQMQGMMGGMMQGMQDGEMMPMMAQMQEMMETCTKMMQARIDQDQEEAN